MKNKSLKLILIIVLIALLGACGTDSSTPKQETDNGAKSSEQAESNEITVKITEDEGAKEIGEKEIVIEEDTILMDVLKENYDLKLDEKHGYIIGIDGHGPEEGEQRGWFFSVNGEFADMGADQYKLSTGDEVSFDLQDWK